MHESEEMLGRKERMEIQDCRAQRRKREGGLACVEGNERTWKWRRKEVGNGSMYLVLLQTFR